MLFRSLAAVAALLVASTPVAAQDLDLRAQVAAFVQPTNAARTDVVVAQLRAAQHRDAQADAAHRAAAALRTQQPLLAASLAATGATQAGAPPRPRTLGRQPALWTPGAR